MSTEDLFEAEAEDVRGAYGFCRELAESRREDIPAAVLRGARSLRLHVAVLTAFAGVADGLAGCSEERRAERLESWRGELGTLRERPSRHPVLLALGRTMSEFDLPAGPFEDILGASIQDCSKTRYETHGEVLDYCRRSAAPLGRLVLMLHGCRDEGLLKLSDSVCAAQRLTRFLRDIASDLARDRIYLPAEDFRETGYTEADLRMGVVNDRYRSLMKQQWKRARGLFEEGRPLAGRLGGPLSRDVELACLEGGEVLRRIQKAGFDTLRRHPVLSRWDRLRLRARVLFRLP